MSTLKEGIPLKIWGRNSVSQLIMICIFIFEIYHFNNRMYIYIWDLSLCHTALLLCPTAGQNLGVCRLFPLEGETANRDWSSLSAVLLLKSNIKKIVLLPWAQQKLHIWKKLSFFRGSTHGSLCQQSKPCLGFLLGTCSFTVIWQEPLLHIGCICMFTYVLHTLPLFFSLVFISCLKQQNHSTHFIHILSSVFQAFVLYRKM